MDIDIAMTQQRNFPTRVQIIPFQMTLCEADKTQSFTVPDSGCKNKRKRTSDESPFRDTI